MKKIVSLLVVGGMILGGATLVRAEGKAMPAAKPLMAIDQSKAKKVEELDQKIKLLQDDKTCVAAAKDKADLKKCREAARAAIKKMREEKKAMREELKAKHEEMRAMKGK